MKIRSNRRVISAVFQSIWAIVPQKMEEIREFLEMRSAGIRLTKSEIQAKISPKRQSQQANQGSKVAVLNLFGVISQRMNAMEEISGGTSTEMFGKAFDAAVADSDIKAIVIHVDSPGGVVTGTPELADKIFAARGKKPIIAVTDSQMASAAYWIASAADEIVATPTAEIGSVGVLTMHTDKSEMNAELGVKHTFITSVPFKAEGNSYEPLSEGSKDYIKSRVMDIHAMFVASLARNLGVSAEQVNSQFGQGRVFMGRDAVSLGMVDRIGTLEGVLAELGVNSGATGVTAQIPRPAFDLKGNSMDPKILTALVRKGLCGVDASEAEAKIALRAFSIANGVAPPADDAPVDLILKGLEGKIDVPQQPPVQTPVESAKAPTATVPEKVAATEEMATEDIMAAIRLAPISDGKKMDLAAELVGKKHGVKQVLDRIGKESADANLPTGATVIRTGAAELDKFRVSARDAILSRAWGSSLPTQIWDNRAHDFADWKPTAHSGRSYSLNSLPRLAEQCMIQAGVPANQVQRLSPAEIAMAIMGKPMEQLGIFAGDGGGAYNLSGMFANILYDASNVMLRRSYTEANTTFQQWMKQGESLPDFKPVHKVIAGELPDPKAIPEDGEFEESTITDGRESYKLTVWGERFSISWQTVVNDRLSAFTEIPMKQGRAMRRKQNKLAYGVLLDNPTLSDTVALFETNSLASGGHNNLTTGAGAPSVTTLNSLYTKMAQMTGLNVAANTVLNLEPKYLVTCPALRGTVLELLGSTANPASGGSAVGNSNIKNIWQNALTPVIDAQLGLAAGGSDTAWYLATDNSDADTIEYAYLQGLESPAMDQQAAFDRLALSFRIYQAFAVKAIDFRGLQKHAGA